MTQLIIFVCWFHLLNKNYNLKSHLRRNDLKIEKNISEIKSSRFFFEKKKFILFYLVRFTFNHGDC